MTRHPRMGAAQQLWLLYRNHREISGLQNPLCRTKLALVLARFAPFFHCTGQAFVKNICLWAATFANLNPIESAICGLR